MEIFRPHTLVTASLIVLGVITGVLLWQPDYAARLHEKLGLPDPELSTFYSAMLDYHLRIDAQLPANAVIFIGDSITQGLCVTCAGVPAANFGIGGDTTTGVLHRLAQYTSVGRSRAVIIAVGINDIPRRDNAAISANYRKILAMIPAHVRVIVSSILPVDETVSSPRSRTNRRIESLNRHIKSICAQRENCTWLDNGVMASAGGNLEEQYHDGDGVHLSSAGYAVWRRQLENALAEVAVP